MLHSCMFYLYKTHIYIYICMYKCVHMYLFLTLSVGCQYLEYIRNSYNSTAEFKNGQRTWIDISPKKIYKWPTRPWKSSQYPYSIGKWKLKPQRSTYEDGYLKKNGYRKQTDSCQRGGGWGLGEKGEGIKQRNKKKDSWPQTTVWQLPKGGEVEGSRRG